MGPGNSSCDEDDDFGLPDAAFTEDELSAGVHHVMRTGNPNAASSGRRRTPSQELDNVTGNSAAAKCAEAINAPLSVDVVTTRFETYAEARTWGQANPGGVIVRAPDGCSFEARPAQRERVNVVQRGIDSYMERSTKIKALAPHLHDVLSKSASNSYRLSMRPFYRDAWQNELSRLSVGQLERLRLLIAVHLEDSRKRLRELYAAMRRDRRMKPGHYGEALSERLNQVMEGALADIDVRLTTGRDA